MMSNFEEPRAGARSSEGAAQVSSEGLTHVNIGFQDSALALFLQRHRDASMGNLVAPYFARLVNSALIVLLIALKLEPIIEAIPLFLVGALVNFAWIYAGRRNFSEIRTIEEAILRRTSAELEDSYIEIQRFAYRRELYGPRTWLVLRWNQYEPLAWLTLLAVTIVLLGLVRGTFSPLT